MMTACRYTCAIVVVIVASLTPSSCSDVNEPAMAADDEQTVVVSETLPAGDDYVDGLTGDESSNAQRAIEEKELGRIGS